MAIGANGRALSLGTVPAFACLAPLVFGPPATGSRQCVAVTTEIRSGVVLADRFRVRRRLGAGGTATVFLAEDCVLCRDVAIKRLRTEGSEADVRRFRREARLGASLTHPNLVTVFDTLSGSDGVLIVMEYVRGRPLSDLITPTGMDARRLLRILRPVASALDYAHERGVVHRDVKPANVLLAEDGPVKLVDLGTATAGHLTQITAENEVAGTLSYIAPERLLGESVGEPAADVYSLAVLAFEALTGRLPHWADTPRELLDRVLHEPPPDVIDEWPQAPVRLARVLQKGMDADPKRRQASAGDFVLGLEAALPDRAAAAQSSSIAPTELITRPTAQEWRKPPESRATPTRRGRPRPGVFRPPEVDSTRHGWLLPAVACIGALLVGGAWLANSGGGGESVEGTGGKKQAADRKQAGGLPKTSAASNSAPSTEAAPSVVGPSTAVSDPEAATSAVGPATAVPDPGTGTQLNAEGYSLIQKGRYAEAIPILRQAVASFPEGTTDLNFAYTLFNLGHALRMVGQPEEAIPILERRLQIPDQTETVRAELEAARAAARQ
jgi:eukaryotic-like serine/threonine-protein kinase